MYTGEVCSTQKRRGDAPSHPNKRAKTEVFQNTKHLMIKFKNKSKKVVVFPLTTYRDLFENFTRRIVSNERVRLMFMYPHGMMIPWDKDVFEEAETLSYVILVFPANSKGNS